MAASSEEAPHSDDVQGVAAAGLWFRCTNMAKEGLRQFYELIQGNTKLSNEAVWLLGTYYAVRDSRTDAEWLTPEMKEMLLADFSSRLWFTYRYDFPAIGTSGCTSDTGWGCTLRSGQMMLAEALLRHVKGRLWARGELSALDPFVLQLLTLFWDSPSEATPFSLHNLCAAGAPAGIEPGNWLGPTQLCRALQAAVNAVQPHGLRVHVLCEPGGGAPSLPVRRLKGMLPSRQQQQEQEQEQEQQAAAARAGQHQEQQWEDAAAAEEQQGAAPKAEAGAATQQEAEQQPAPAPEASSSPAPSTSPPLHPQQQQQQQVPPSALLLLVPITLGPGSTANPHYLPQLQHLLQCPSTVGIVGGRPGSSLYFLGTQGDTLLYMDPHQTQRLADLPGDIATYFCDTIRVMQLAAIDPSLALGFYCRDQEELQELAALLQQMQAEHQHAPLITVDLREGDEAEGGQEEGGRGQRRGAGSEGGDDGAASASEASGFVGADGSRDVEDWELV